MSLPFFGCDVLISCMCLGRVKCTYSFLGLIPSGLCPRKYMNNSAQLRIRNDVEARSHLFDGNGSRLYISEGTVLTAP